MLGNGTNALRALVVATLVLATSATASAAVPEACVEVCREEGRCALVGGECAAVSESACAWSRGCAEDHECFLDPDERRCEDRRRDTGMMVGGIVTTGLGGLAVVLGGLFLGISAGLDSSDGKLIGGVIMGGGGALVAAGIPLLALGAPHRDPPEVPPPNLGLTLGPGRVALSLAF